MNCLHVVVLSETLVDREWMHLHKRYLPQIGKEQTDYITQSLSLRIYPACGLERERTMLEVADKGNIYNNTGISLQF